MLYELRHYDIRSSRGLDQVTQRFANHTLRIWKRIGIEPVGFWSIIVGSPIPRLTYMLAWDNMAQREILWDTFTADPEWQQVRRETEDDWGGSPVHTYSNSILKPTEYSRLPRNGNQPSRLAGGVFELRTYHFDDMAALAQTAEWFGNPGAPAFETHGLYAMGFWTTYIGISPRLTYMLVFENLAHRERAWASFYTDPLWPARQDGLYPGGKPLFTQIESCIMKGTDFSGWK
ncbi:MAG: NIPSNAP family protein [Janthinobacterium lividum]